MCTTKFDQLMNKGKNLEERKLYRRAANVYNQAFSISIPGSPDGLSYQEKESKTATDRCLSKAKIKVTESYL
ncbi:hypothetical protein [Providencia rettgeri]|uniref:hypothetical protein n=1 Tax=Providencia rettgeri TaxID=587 RepID=UPI0023614BC3|nr:hypothetical protein [Providencia rettgeri]